MTPAAFFGIAACGVSVAAVCVLAAVAAVRAARLGRRVKGLASHPTVLALREGELAAERFAGVAPVIARVRARLSAASRSFARIVSAAAIIELNVDRVAFATKLFLATFVPTLAGSMADD